VLLASGEAVLSYTPMAGTPPTADDAVPLVATSDVVPQVLEQLPGWRVATSDRNFAAALVAAGCRRVRHAHVYSCALVAEPREPTRPPTDLGGLVVAGVDEPTPDLVDLLLAAYPPGHPDCETTDRDVAARDLDDLLSGRVIGPLMGASRCLLDGLRPVALLVINRMPGTAPLGGPWVSDICRRPEPPYRGVGAALLRLGMANLAAAGERSLSLAVTEGNPARATYERLGFRHAQTSWKVQVPSE